MTGSKHFALNVVDHLGAFCSRIIKTNQTCHRRKTKRKGRGRIVTTGIVHNYMINCFMLTAVYFIAGCKWSLTNFLDCQKF